MNPMGLSSPWDNSLDIIALQTENIPSINPMGISAPRSDSLEIISLQP